ncbi:unnamed protein product [Didymodactylos carnosus]|uniref:Uncharacterized protein n=1 Tax=Didymodactylos carnosus TaxID=1234261 RepID=A0A814RDP0_9BILA|nr:unnamed protein product [Didymodactylos carnosus]CAF1132500.1 unnamed protein product [Didymodactylos carnosus]CAF3765627.1 unnamed protein product [Didymodactylos carnosus]CAF3896317.1 unnamed protein product [Didymodactylos carnosus]
MGVCFAVLLSIPCSFIVILLICQKKYFFDDDSSDANSDSHSQSPSSRSSRANERFIINGRYRTPPPSYLPNYENDPPIGSPPPAYLQSTSLWEESLGSMPFTLTVAQTRSSTGVIVQQIQAESIQQVQQIITQLEQQNSTKLEELSTITLNNSVSSYQTTHEGEFKTSEGNNKNLYQILPIPHNFQHNVSILSSTNFSDISMETFQV